MPADPLVMPQTSLPYACPEVLLFLRHMTDDYFELISFQAQDIWSLGCLLVWLIMGRDPFAWFPSTESDLLMGHMECLCKKHAAWVSLRSSSCELKHLWRCCTLALLSPWFVLRCCTCTSGWLQVIASENFKQMCSWSGSIQCIHCM